MSLFDSDNDLQETIDKWIAHGKLSKLLELWVGGIKFDWEKLHTTGAPKRISLPTYPFARERYWIDTSQVALTNDDNAQTSVIHPLLHKNISNFSEQKYYTKLSGKEEFFGAANEAGDKALPSIAHLEMIGEAVKQAAGVDSNYAVSVALSNVVWSKAILVNGTAKELSVGLVPDQRGAINYEISDHAADDKADASIYSEGEAKIAEPSGGILNLDALKKDEILSYDNSDDERGVYQLVGIDSGRKQRKIDGVFRASKGVMLKLASAEGDSQNDPLEQGADSEHFCLLDSAIQYSLWALINRDTDLAEQCTCDVFPYYPFAVDQVELGAVPNSHACLDLGEVYQCLTEF